MATPEASATTATTPMIVCPTTHNDWDWQMTFEQYYTTAWNNYGVRGILDSVTTIFEGTTTQDAAFCFSYAEVGFLRQYLTDNPDKAAVLAAAGSRFCLLGGGITSPDNQVCHSEVFIRNYLTGHEYLRSVGLLGNVFFVSWLPDDFGHSPQLPVLIEALGMNSIGLSRIPGSPQPALCPATQLANADVRAAGLTFTWPGNDGSNVLTHFMPATYYGITNYGVSNSAQSDMEQFLEHNGSAVWPGGIVFATQGGDWQFPTSSAPGGTASGAYDWAGAIGATVSGGGITATGQLGTFADYYNALMASPGDIKPFTLYAENYWTGYFASRPQLKLDHYQAAQLLLGAEALGALLAVYSGTTAQEQAQLAQAIAQGWNLLVPTSHHDYVTGTSPDNVYEVPDPPANPVWDDAGQLSMSAQALTLAGDAMDVAMTQLAAAADVAQQQQNEIPVVVFNQLGRDLPATAIVEMADPSNGATDYQVRVGANVGPVQRSSDNTLLFQVPGMLSMAFQVVYLIPTGPATPPAQPVTVDADYVLTNGMVDLTLAQGDGWAIQHLVIDGNDYVQQDDTYANRIGLWNDTGNIYQFGMEYDSGCTTYTFSFDSFLRAGSAQVLEQGPVRWRFLGNLTDDSGNAYTTQYDLVAGETLVRITTNGAAPSNTSVLTSFSMQTVAGTTASALEYGTSYYWDNREPQASWQGLIFRASHDFAQLATASEAVAAVYHNGIPAWTIDGSILRGCLLRNTPGGGRGASGSDNAPHTQTYTLDVVAQLAATGYPLRTSLYSGTPLRAALVNMNVMETIPVAAQLASIAQSDAVLCVAKVSPAASGGNLILRAQRSGTGSEQLDIDLPFLAGSGAGTPEIVTALENTPANPTPVTVSGTTASFQADRALMTMQVPFGGGASS